MNSLCCWTREGFLLRGLILQWWHHYLRLHNLLLHGLLRRVVLHWRLLLLLVLLGCRWIVLHGLLTRLALKTRLLRLRIVLILLRLAIRNLLWSHWLQLLILGLLLNWELHRLLRRGLLYWLLVWGHLSRLVRLLLCLLLRRHNWWTSNRWLANKDCTWITWVHQSKLLLIHIAVPVGTSWSARWKLLADSLKILANHPEELLAASFHKPNFKANIAR